MESSKEKKVERAIQQIMDDNNENNKTRNNSNSSGGESFVAVNADDDEEDRLLLTRLLSQLDAVGDDEKLNQQRESSSLFDVKEEEEEEEEEAVVSNDAVMVPTAAAGETDLNEGSSSNCGIVVVDNGEEILRELKEVKRQNFITHCLLSVMIVLTIGWQLSEVSLILKVKDGVRHPFRSLGSMVKGMIPKGPIALDRNGGGGGGGGGGQNGEKQQHPIQAYCPSSLPDLKIPEFPHVELPDFEFTNDEH